MVTEVANELPPNTAMFLVNQGEESGTVNHLLEKLHIPIVVFLDTDGSVGKTTYGQPKVGIPFGRSYVVDSQGTVTAVMAGYSPAAVLAALAQ